MKQFFAVWGNWQKDGDSYKPETQNDLTIDTMIEEMGYEPDQIEAIERLEIGQTWRSRFGNHFVVRIYDKQ